MTSTRGNYLLYLLIPLCQLIHHSSQIRGDLRAEQLLQSGWALHRRIPAGGLQGARTEGNKGGVELESDLLERRRQFSRHTLVQYFPLECDQLFPQLGASRRDGECIFLWITRYVTPWRRYRPSEITSLTTGCPGWFRSWKQSAVPLSWPISTTRRSPRCRVCTPTRLWSTNTSDASE